MVRKDYCTMILDQNNDMEVIICVEQLPPSSPFGEFRQPVAMLVVQNCATALVRR
jgi:hypothetical protein